MPKGTTPRRWVPATVPGHPPGHRRPAGEGTTLNNLSQIYQAQGDYATALGYLQQSLAIRRAIGDRAGEGATLNNLSQIYQAQGDYATALEYLQQALAIGRAIGDRAGEGATLNNLSQIYQAQGDYATALDYLQQSLAIGRAIGDRAGKDHAQQYLADLSCPRGLRHGAGLPATVAGHPPGHRRPGGGRDHAQQYLADLSGPRGLRHGAGLPPTVAGHQPGHRQPGGVMCDVFNIGLIHYNNDEPQQALASWVAAYRIAREIGLAEALQNLDKLAKRLGGAGLEYWEMLARQLPAGEDGG